MRLYLVRHGHALPGEADPEPSLSARGHSEVERVAAFLGRAGIRVRTLAHSGKTRARQTAELLAPRIAAEGCIEGRTGMDPLDPTGPLADEAETWKEDVMLVGHLPFMGKLAARLIADGDERELLAFRTGSVACLEKKGATSWTLVWMLGPELLGDA